MLKGKVLVTGATGFFGKHLCQELTKQGYYVIGIYLNNIPELDNYYISNLASLDGKAKNHLHSICRLDKPDYIIHAAGYNGGIKFNLENPYDIYMKNVTMGTNIINAAIEHKIKKVISIVTSCAYGEYCPVEYVGEIDYELNNIMHPDTFMEGKPNPTVECHGYAKRHLQLLSKYAHQQYGLNAVTACITTMYGPGDSLDLNRTKVMMALIKRFVDAKKEKAERVTCWGTGQPRRQFIYVKDAAKCVVKALEDYNINDVPVNISPLGDTRLSQLVREIAWAVDYKGEIAWDYTKPDGQMKKELVPHEMFKDFKFTGLTQGIKETIEWYQSLGL